MAVPEWPRAAFRLRAEDWHLAGSTPSTGGIFGPGTAIHVENRVWRVSADLVALPPDHWRAVRAILDLSRGRFAPIRIPVITGDALRAPAERYGFSTGFGFKGGVRFAGTSLAGVSVVADAPPGASLLQLSVAPEALQLSAMFSLPGDRVHRIAGRDGARVMIEPPLRVAARPGDPAEFLAPWARMRVDLDDARLPRQSGQMSRPQVIPLVEALR